MELSIFKLIMIIIVATIVWDFVRLLIFKLLSKKMKMFNIVPDTYQLRLSYVSQKLGIPVTDIVNEEDTYFDINNPNEVYKIKCISTYQLDLVDANGQVVEATEETQEVSEEVVEETSTENTED